MNAVVQFQAPRLPYHPVVEERFGVDRSGWKVLCEAVFPAAETPDSIVMALAYCRARNLDIFKKPVQIVPIYDKKRGKMVDTVWPGIAELRTTAMRTGSFAGFDETQFGPVIEDTLSGVEVKYPEWAQCIVYRIVAGQRVPFIGPKTYWIETYATAKRDTAAPNAMWKKRPRGQLEKCAEAAALRRAFPEELGNEYAAEEVEGQAFGTMRDVTPKATGMLDRLEAREPTGGFSAQHVEAELANLTPAEADEILDGDDLPSHDPETGEIVETAQDAEISETLTGEAPEPATATSDDDFPGNRQEASFEPLEWAAEQNRMLETFGSVKEIDDYTSDPEVARLFGILEQASPGVAKALQAASRGRRKALADKERVAP